MHGFRTMSHAKAVLTKSTMVDPRMRYPPYSARSLSIVSWVVINSRWLRLPKRSSLLYMLAALAAMLWWLRRRR